MCRLYVRIDTANEVSIERRTPSGGEGKVASQGPVTSTEEISIPLKKEERGGYGQKEARYWGKRGNRGSNLWKD